MQKTPKIGLALGSGGTRGLAHIGVIKALIRHKIPINYIAGTSIGAIIGAMYAAGQSIADIEEKLVNKKWEAFRCLLDPTLNGGFVKGGKVGILLSEWIGVKTFAELKIPLTVVTADLISGKEIIFNEGDLITPVRASMSVPTLFQPVKLNDFLLADGGIINPVPDDVVRAMGSDFVIAVNLDERIKSTAQPTKYTRINNVSLRAFHIIRHYLAQYSIHDADVIIAPEIPESGLVGLGNYFTKNKAVDFINIGERLTEEVMPLIREKLKKIK